MLHLLLISLLLIITQSFAQTSPTQAKSAIFAQIFSGYDNDTRPLFNTTDPTTGGTNPVIINTQFRVNLLYSVSSRDEQFNIDLFVTETWLDERLIFDQSMWDPSLLGALRVPLTKPWKPDTFFYNALSCVTSDQLLTLTYEGKMSWTRHLTCSVHDAFSLSNFPFDSQSLPLTRLSFAYNMNELSIVHTDPCYSPDPSVNYQNSLWDLNGAATCSNGFLSFRSSQAPYSIVTATLNVKRKAQNYIVKLILPMFIIVLLSTLTYWIDPTSPPARIGATVTLVLSIVTFNITVSSDLPKINYSTLIDWFVWYCFIFVIFAVAEFATVHHILYTKIIPTKFAYLIDDFCAYTLPPVWCLTNLLAWPPVLGNSEAAYGFVLAITIGYIMINFYRTTWNYSNDKRGTAMYVHYFRVLLRLLRLSKHDPLVDQEEQAAK